jgi:hypothetical protein
MRGHVDVVHLLVERGVDKDPKDRVKALIDVSILLSADINNPS